MFNTFLKSLHDYIASLIVSSAPFADDQIRQAEECIRFLTSDKNSFERSNTYGHFTGSSLIVDDVSKSVLLVHHKKYGKWVQPGGHCDGVTDPFFTAWQESYQEAGLRDIRPVAPWVIADINIEMVPAYRDVPAHLHFDIRYVLRAGSCEKPVISDESNDVIWVPVAKLREYTDEAPLIRLVERHFGVGSTERP
ncbi:NUDIX hydrolase [Rhizobium sp. BK176]|uniref:NUDIX hydrolase n=1 Tax=Rhizobium sp. BK176 TaxID=2587071 RepID=UPI00216705D2|nr:NUDIX domain-containing protein [Rhizobium sp. BK176]MCS4089751.1 8-oxo-dGTP pyrophosphatase MutT (NUDIX family) [Rhizobium sp. BK176]